MRAPTDPGSFRDREGQVFYSSDRVCRALSALALEEWEALAGADFFIRAMQERRVVNTRRVPLPPDAPPAPAQAWAGALEHDRIPFISYPYEWSFGMLQDAALLQLDLLAEALQAGFILKDSSSYNVQWCGTRPVFIDVPSFQRHAPNEPWTGYLQFCQLFLFPLMLTAYQDLPFHPWLRGAIDGITPEAANRLLSGRARWRRGVFTHAYLQSRLQAATADARHSMRRTLSDSGFSRELIFTNVRGLRRLVSSFRWRQKSSAWVAYRETHSYTDEDYEAKRRFVATAAAAAPRALVWDLGCNTGDFARVCLDHADYVVALDADPLAIERLYRELRNTGEQRILPLVGNLTDPSPGLGWQGAERRPLPTRGRPDLVLALALLHHLVIAANVPLDAVVDWLASLGGDLVIEFVAREDPMVQRLLLNKDDRYADYALERLEQALSRNFQIESRLELKSGTRTLIHARRP
jgi:SAM-dependent methyltransferase